MLFDQLFSISFFHSNSNVFDKAKYCEFFRGWEKHAMIFTFLSFVARAYFFSLAFFFATQNIHFLFYLLMRRFRQMLCQDMSFKITSDSRYHGFLNKWKTNEILSPVHATLDYTCLNFVAVVIVIVSNSCWILFHYFWFFFHSFCIFRFIILCMEFPTL